MPQRFEQSGARDSLTLRHDRSSTDEVSRIVQKGEANDTGQRSQEVIDLIADVERLAASPTDTPA
jgi:hypothetical protein